MTGQGGSDCNVCLWDQHQKFSLEGTFSQGSKYSGAVRLRGIYDVAVLGSQTNRH